MTIQIARVYPEFDEKFIDVDSMFIRVNCINKTVEFHGDYPEQQLEGFLKAADMFFNSNQIREINTNHEYNGN